MLSNTIKKVLEPQKKRSFREKELKIKVIEIITEKINNYSSYGKTNCYYKVPPVLMGYILYKQESLTKYLLHKLYKEGFYVKEIYQNILYISWDIKDVQKVQEEKKNEKIKTINKQLNNSKKLIAFASTEKIS